MRVVFDGLPLLPPRSGVGQYTYQLIRALGRRAPDDEHVVFYACSRRVLPQAQPPPFPEPSVRVLAESLWPRIVRKVSRRLGRPVAMPIEQFVGPCDIYHAPNNMFVHPVRSARRVVTIHDMTLVLFPEWHPGARIEQMGEALPRSTRLADHVIVPSLSTKRDITAQLGIDPERITVIPEAADASFPPREPEATATTLRDFGLVPGEYLLFVGTIEPRKNLLRLLEALRVLAGRVGPLVVAGADGWRNREIRLEIDRMAETGQVRYLGYVPDGARPALMSAARLFVYPSLYEGFGLPVLEAMACGTPVVTSNVSSLPEVVGDAGILVDPVDVKELAGALERLWDDAELRRDLGMRGRLRAADFSWERTADLTREVYHKVVDGR